jgi:putative transposase
MKVSANSDKKASTIISIDEGLVQDQLSTVVRDTVEVTLNKMLDEEADRLCNARRYERKNNRQNWRAGHYDRSFETKAGAVNLQVPKLRVLPFETAIIERYRRREASVEEALVEMYLAGVSVRRVEDITEALWGTKVSPSTLSRMNKEIYGKINEWRLKPIEGRYPYVYLDGIGLKRSWGGEVRNVSVLVAIGVGEDGYRSVLGVTEGDKEDKEGWSMFLRQLKERGLREAQLFITDKCLGLIESLGEYYPGARWQRCVVHFYRNVFTVVPKGKIREVVSMLKAIHAQEDRAEALKKAQAVAAKLKEMKLQKAAHIVEEGIEETLAYMSFPSEHWIKIRTNNPLERIMREIRRRTRVVGSFPDGESALMLVAARLRYIAGKRWGTCKYMAMEKSYKTEEVLTA